MNEKIEIARLATELTIALINDSKQRLDTDVIFAARRSGADKDTPDALVLFDAMYDHLITKLTPQ